MLVAVVTKQNMHPTFHSHTFPDFLSLTQVKLAYYLEMVTEQLEEITERVGYMQSSFMIFINSREVAHKQRECLLATGVKTNINQIRDSLLILM